MPTPSEDSFAVPSIASRGPPKVRGLDCRADEGIAKPVFEAPRAKIRTPPLPHKDGSSSVAGSLAGQLTCAWSWSHGSLRREGDARRRQVGAEASTRGSSGGVRCPNSMITKATSTAGESVAIGSMVASSIPAEVLAGSSRRGDVASRSLAGSYTCQPRQKAAVSAWQRRSAEITRRAALRACGPVAYGSA